MEAGTPPKPRDRTADLPEELIDAVLSYLPAASLARSLAVDERWGRRAARDAPWRALAVERWGSEPDVRRGGATRAGFLERAESEADAIIFYSVVQRVRSTPDGVEGCVLAECALAPGGYPRWWRKVAKATARRALRSPPGHTVTIDVGDAPEDHRRARRRGRRGSSHFRSVLATTTLAMDGAETGTFCACLAVFPLVEPGADHASFLVRKRGVASFLARLRDWHGVEAFFARSAAELSGRAAPGGLRARRPPPSEEDPVDAALRDLTTPAPAPPGLLDPAHCLERFMVAANAALKRLALDDERDQFPL